MIERAMWIASGSHSGLVLMMMERDAPTGYTALDTMLTTTSIGIDSRTFLGNASPRKSTEIHAEACGGMQPNALALICLLVWAMHRPEE